jgi:hypothetical protein
MSRLLMSGGEVSTIGLLRMKQIREQTINKWDSLGFLKGLRGHVKENITELYKCCDGSTKIKGMVKHSIKKHKI